MKNILIDISEYTCYNLFDKGEYNYGLTEVGYGRYMANHIILSPNYYNISYLNYRKKCSEKLNKSNYKIHKKYSLFDKSKIIKSLKDIIK